MSALQALLLGIVQGLTEFLPVSSSGHLVLFQNIMGIGGDVLLFDTMLHVGTLVAVVVLLRGDILAILRRPFSRMTLYLVIATVPAALLGALFNDFVESTFGGAYLGYGLLLTSVILFTTPLLQRGQTTEQDMGAPRAACIGLAQAVALLPGISRSGSTIAGGLACGLNRESAARFSFLLSIPIILGSTVFQSKDLIGMAAGAPGSAVGIVPLLVGMLAAMFSGLLALMWMFRIVKQGRLWAFGIYTGALGILVLLDQMIFHLIF